VKKRAGAQQGKRVSAFHLRSRRHDAVDLGEHFGWSSFLPAISAPAGSAGSKWIVWTVRASISRRRAADPGCVPDGCERMHDPVHMREMLVSEYKTADGRQVRICERVAAFHRAEQRNDVEMIFYIAHRDGRQERLVFAWPLRYFFGMR